MNKFPLDAIRLVDLMQIPNLIPGQTSGPLIPSGGTAQQEIVEAGFAYPRIRYDAIFYAVELVAGFEDRGVDGRVERGGDVTWTGLVGL